MATAASTPFMETPIAAWHGGKIPDQQMYGVEVELENVSDRVRDEGLALWHIVDDGSLRNNGKEFRFPRPYTQKDLTAAIQELVKSVIVPGMKRKTPMLSVRTSTHVHIDVRRFTPEQLRGICVTYALAEPFLMQWCGPLREENIYCVPWYRSLDAAGAYVIADGTMDPIRKSSAYTRAIQRTRKYSALFLGPMGRFGSIEFRSAPALTDADMYLLWAEALSALVWYGASMPADRIMEEFERTANKRHWIQSVLGRELYVQFAKPLSFSYTTACRELDVLGVAGRFLPDPAEAVSWTRPPRPTSTEEELARAREVLNRQARYRPTGRVARPQQSAPRIPDLQQMNSIQEFMRREVQVDQEIRRAAAAASNVDWARYGAELRRPFTAGDQLVVRTTPADGGFIVTAEPAPPLTDAEIRAEEIALDIEAYDGDDFVEEDLG